MTDTKVVSSHKELDWLQWWVTSAEWLTFDLETRGLDDHSPTGCIIAVAFTREPGESWVVPIHHPESPWDDPDAVAARLFEWMVGLKLNGHNVKYDVRWGHTKTGVDLSEYQAWDTMTAGALLDENRELDLESMSMERLGVRPWEHRVDKKNLWGEPLDKVCTYAGHDTDYSHQLMLQQRDRLREVPELGRLYWYLRAPAQRALTRVEYLGLLLDHEETERLHTEKLERSDELRDELEASVPPAVRERHQEEPMPELWNRDPDPEPLSWQPTSNFFKDYASTVWPKLAETPTGAPSWDKGVLKKLALRGHDNAATLLQYRRDTQRINTFLSRWPDDVDQQGRIHATYNLARTVTGRLSCSSPNLQQVARDIKTAFRSEDGRWFVQIDYSQLEVRIAAHLAPAERLIELYREGRDVYVELAARVNGKPQDEVTKDERQKAKVAVLGFLYGMGASSFQDYAFTAYDVRYTLDEAEQVRTLMLEHEFPGLTSWHERVRRTVRRDGFIRSPIGQVRRVPDALTGDKFERGRAERQAINAPVQSLASDIMLMSLIEVDREIRRGMSARIVGTVHDSMLLEIPEGRHDVVERVMEIMLDPGLMETFGLELSVPLAVEAEVGRNWGDPDEVIERTQQWR